MQTPHSVAASGTGTLPSPTPIWHPYALPKCSLCYRISQPIRLLAVVVAKNAVGSSWRKTLGTREWSRVPDSEKAMVREGAMQLLLNGEATACAPIVTIRGGMVQRVVGGKGHAAAAER